MDIKLHPLNSLPANDFYHDYLIFNDINHDVLDLWDNSVKRYVVPLGTSLCLFIMDHIVLGDLISHDKFNLLKFLSNNKLWIRSGQDTTLYLNSIIDQLLELDTQIPKNAITLFHECRVSRNSKFFKLKNIKNNEFLYNPMFEMNRIKGSSIVKNKQCKDFLLTMTKQPKKQHRDLLWNELNNRPELLKKGISSFKPKNEVGSTWLGNTPYDNHKGVYRPAIDLYKNCWLEVVPETCHLEHYFTTEKTIKPILTKTPFLVLSTPGYLSYLRDIGFQTFSGLIDESYDQINNINDRTKRLVEILEHICDNGAESFYISSKEILDYNFNRLIEISGSRQFDNDLYLHHCLIETGILPVDQ